MENHQDSYLHAKGPSVSVQRGGLGGGSGGLPVDGSDESETGGRSGTVLDNRDSPHTPGRRLAAVTHNTAAHSRLSDQNTNRHPPQRESATKLKHKRRAVASGSGEVRGACIVLTGVTGTGRPGRRAAGRCV